MEPNIKSVTEQSNIIVVKSREVYGNVLYYPDNALADAICKLTGNTTIRKSDVRAIKALGFSIVTLGSAEPL